MHNCKEKDNDMKFVADYSGFIILPGYACQDYYIDYIYYSAHSILSGSAVGDGFSGFFSAVGDGVNNI